MYALRRNKRNYNTNEITLEACDQRNVDKIKKESEKINSLTPHAINATYLE